VKLGHIYDVEWFKLAEDMRRVFNSPTHAQKVTGLHYQVCYRAWNGIEIRTQSALILCYHMQTNPVDYLFSKKPPYGASK